MMTNVKHVGDPSAPGMSLDELGLVARPDSIALQRPTGSGCSNSSIICGIKSVKTKQNKKIKTRQTNKGETLARPIRLNYSNQFKIK